MKRESWKEIGAREKMQIVNGTALVFAAIVLYFLAFIFTLTVGYPIVSAGATMLGSGLAFFGITAFVRNEMVQLETTVDMKLKQMEEEKGELTQQPHHTNMTIPKRKRKKNIEPQEKENEQPN
jgi:hypothetical protein